MRLLHPVSAERELVSKREKAHITGWRRLIGSPKLHIIFHKRATKYRSLLRKMTYKDKGSYHSSPPCRREISHPSLSSDMCHVPKILHMCEERVKLVSQSVYQKRAHVCIYAYGVAMISRLLKITGLFCRI